MAHEIEIVAGRARMAYAGEAPWHRLGQKIDPNAPAEEWIKAAGLDWTVSPRDVFLAGHDKPVSAFRALVRDDDEAVLDMVGADWEPIQNWQAFKFFEKWCQTGKLRLETAGALRGGRDVWVLAKAMDGFSLAGGDEVESYVLFDNPHQRGRAALIIPTPIRVVCANTQGWALEKHEKAARRMEARFTHVGDGRYSEAAALEQLHIIDRNFQEFEDRARLLASRRCPDGLFEKFIGKVYDLKPWHTDDADLKARREAHNRRVVESLKVIAETQPGASMAPGTWWNAYNAVTYDVDHSPRREVGDDKALGSAWLGAGKLRKELALQVACEMAA